MAETNTEKFLDKSNIIAVVGASRDPEKYGHKIYKDLRDEGFDVYPVNPKADEILSDKAYSTLDDLPEKPDVVDMVIPPKIGINVVKKCSELGIDKVWLQPGSESEEIINYCQENDIKQINNACMMLKTE